MRALTEFFAKIFDFWHKFISPALPAACRHEPTCSVYAAEALRSHGLLRGSFLGLTRLLRCHPWSTAGYDPVPAARILTPSSASER